jgi:hypothetical protein
VEVPGDELAFSPFQRISPSIKAFIVGFPALKPSQRTLWLFAVIIVVFSCFVNWWSQIGRKKDHTK